MKSILKTVIISTVFSTALLFVSCGSKAEKAEEKSETADSKNQNKTTAYVCPMKCEGEKTYDKAGACPTCGMDLEEVK